MKDDYQKTDLRIRRIALDIAIEIAKEVGEEGEVKRLEEELKLLNSRNNG